MTPVLYEASGGIGLVTLNRPEALNAINSELLEALVTALTTAIRADDVSVVLLRASGRAFCAGDDLKEFRAKAPDEVSARRFVERLQEVTRLLMLGDKPVVCAVQGWIVGGGTAWLLNADFAIVADDVTLFCPEAGLGLFPSGGMTLLLAERCGATAANEVLWRGARWNAAALLEHSLATQVVARADLDPAALALAHEILRLPAAARLRLKRAASRLLRARLDEALAYEQQCCVAAALEARIDGPGPR